MSESDINKLYRQRNNLAIAFCKAALAAGWRAGRGIDSKKDNDDEWRHVVYITLPNGGQVSWHIAPSEVHLLDGIPEYTTPWDGTFLARDKNWPNLIGLVRSSPYETAAKWVDNRMQDYVKERGSYDHDTGYTELPGTGDEYVEELSAISEGIRKLGDER